MEELIKKYSEKFLDYANSEKELKKEIEDLDSRIARIRQVIIKHENFVENPSKRIEELDTQIYKINEEMTNLGIEKNVNQIREELGNASGSEKKIKDYEINIELDTLKTKKQKSIDKIEEIRNSEWMLKTSKEHTKKLEKMKSEKLQELENKKDYLIKIVEEKIQEKSVTISNIQKIKENMIEKNKNDIEELRKVIEYISKQKYEDRSKQIIQRETLISVQTELEEKRENLNRDIKESSKRISMIEEELSNLRNLKEDLDVGNAKGLIYKSLNIQEEKEEKFDDFFEDECKKDDNLEEKKENQSNPRYNEDKEMVRIKNTKFYDFVQVDERNWWEKIKDTAKMFWEKYLIK